MKEVLASVLNRIEIDRNFVFVFPDGDSFRKGEGKPDFTVRFRTWQAVKESMTRGSMGFGECYMREEIDIEGDVQEVSKLGFELVDNHLQPSLVEKFKFIIGYFSRRNTLTGSRKNISAHYDLGNDFYSLWLDREAMQYTCAYFETPHDTIEQAQLQKIDLVCRKLRIQPGETLVEAGCGWGGFGLRAAQKWGARVRSYNISKEQIAYARDKAKRLGIPTDRLEYVHDDYRTIGQDGRTYDKFASIGMLEHVGVENYAGLYDIIHKVTKPKGMALVHSIGRIAPRLTDPWLEKYIFPGSRMPSLSEIVTSIELDNERPLHVVDVENLRYHYALTLDWWSRRFEENVDKIRGQYGEGFVRMFRLYLRGAAAGFRYGGILLFQVLMCNGYDDAAPLTRQYMMRGSVGAAAGRNGSGSRANAVKNGRGLGAVRATAKRTAKKR